jgi:hypothetical protein
MTRVGYVLRCTFCSQSTVTLPRGRRSDDSRPAAGGLLGSIAQQRDRARAKQLWERACVLGQLAAWEYR